MKYLLSAVIAVFLSAHVFAAGDYIPITQGNTWLFNYKKVSGGWGSSITDSGTIRWEMISVITYITYPAQVEATVVETKSICRRTYRPGKMMPGDTTGYDSVFVPFRVTQDTILLKGLIPGNGVTIDADTCWSFVHDPKGTIPAGKLIARDTTVSCLGQTLSASVIDPAPCAGQYADQSYYITAADLGPVEYHMHSSQYLMDAFWQEDWRLYWTNLSPVVGGPCAYSKYLGTVLITGMWKPVLDTPSTANDNQYSVRFRFFTNNTIRESWAASLVNQENDISVISGIAGNLALYRIKPGNSYACTLDVINAGSCAPLIYHLKPPSPVDNIDTSSIWIMPDSTVENKPFELTLFSYSFTCNTMFSEQSFSQNAGAVYLTYKAVENPLAGICAPSTYLYGISFAAPAQTTGKYPVYSVLQPACYPLCDVAVMPKLIDTLYVVKALSADMRVRRSSSGAGKTSIYSVKGRTVFEGNVSKPGVVAGSFYSLNGALLGSFKTENLSVGWHRIEVPDRMNNNGISAKGPVMIVLTMPDKSQVRKLVLRY